jgi:hypothetical protein
VKQQPIGRTPIAEHQRPELIGERKHDLKVDDLRQQQLGRPLAPMGAATATAQGAVAVDAGVVDRAAMLTLRALVDMPAQRGRPAERQFGQHALHLRHRLTTVVLQIVRRVLPQQVAYVEGFAGALGGWSARAGCGFCGEPLLADTLDDGPWFGSIHRGHWRTGSQSSGLGTEAKCGWRTCR